MKKLFLVFVILAPLFVKAQAHLGATVSQVKSNHPDKTFESSYLKDGVRCLYTEMDLGTFYYYFDKMTGLSNICIQVPKNMAALNAQVEIYNKKYVILSETKWKAYLDEGGIINIRLEYSEDLKSYIFIYTS